jgi:hypothetical protein
MDLETMKRRAESYSSRREKSLSQTYALRDKVLRLPQQTRFQTRTLSSPEPRTPLPYLELLISERRRRIQERFRGLVQSWKKEVAFESSLTEILMNHNYLKIIGLGPRALPLIFQELEREPDLWFLALESITGKDPAASEDNTGDFKRISDIWLQGGRDRGFI